MFQNVKIGWESKDNLWRFCRNVQDQARFINTKKHHYSLHVIKNKSSILPRQCIMFWVYILRLSQHVEPTIEFYVLSKVGCTHLKHNIILPIPNNSFKMKGHFTKCGFSTINIIFSYYCSLIRASGVGDDLRMNLPS